MLLQARIFELTLDKFMGIEEINSMIPLLKGSLCDSEELSQRWISIQ